MPKKQLELKGMPSPKQIEFFEARAPHIAYGGARGGGKSWAMRRKFVLLASRYAGLRLLLLRRTFPELEANHIMPLRAELEGYARYSAEKKMFTFPNGSILKLGYCDTEADVYQYQGQEYEVIGFEEATQFTEFQMKYISTCNRTTRTDFKPRIYYTCNPGGVGHDYIKRLFIDRQYTEWENPDDYVFIPAKVSDNKALMDADPQYVKNLQSLPDHLRKAYLDGEWDVIEGQYFSEFQKSLHVIDPFPIPAEWKKFRSMDWGYNDPCCVLWFAVAPDRHIYIYREYYARQRLAVDVAHTIKSMSGTENIAYTVASPDAWQHRGARDVYQGECIADTFAWNGVPLLKADNDRLSGWQRVHENLAVAPDGQPYLQIFSTCKNLIRTLPLMTYGKVTSGRHEDVADGLEDHACLTGDTLVVTTEGRIPIRELVGKTGELISTEDGKTPCVRRFSDCRMTRANAEVYEVETEDGVFRATADHKVLLETGEWKQVKDLTDADSIVNVLSVSRRVISVKHVVTEPVYNLEVEGTHCFAVNDGFIVHNCESLRYGLMSRPSPIAVQERINKAKILKFDPLAEPKDRVIEGGFFGII